MGNFWGKKKQVINYNGEYWNFYLIKIPIHIDSIPSMDRVNKIINRGTGETLMDGINIEPYTLKEYHKKYAVIGTDGKLYWKE